MADVEGMTYPDSRICTCNQQTEKPIKIGTNRRRLVKEEKKEEQKNRQKMNQHKHDIGTLKIVAKKDRNQ